MLRKRSLSMKSQFGQISQMVMRNGMGQGSLTPFYPSNCKYAVNQQIILIKCPCCHFAVLIHLDPQFDTIPLAIY